MNLRETFNYLRRAVSPRAWSDAYQRSVEQWREQLASEPDFDLESETGDYRTVDDDFEEALPAYYRIYCPAGFEGHGAAVQARVSGNRYDRKHQDPKGCRTLGWLVVLPDGSHRLEG